MKTKRTSKKRLEANTKFIKEVEAYLLSIGAVNNRLFYDWELETVGGKLWINVRAETIFCRFENPAFGAKFTRGASNPYSGKWNRHYFEDVLQPDCWSDWRSCMEKLIGLNHAD